MLIALHKQARTTPAVRAEIAASSEPVSKLARRYHVTAATIRKWQSRTDFQDRSPTAHHLQTTLMRRLSSICARRCGCLWMTCWRSPASFFVRESRVRDWTAACAAMGWAIYARCNPW